MTIHRDKRNGLLILRPEGELVADQPTGLPDAVNTALGDGHLVLLLDLSQVPYVNSSGIGELVKCAAQVNLQKGKLALVNLSPFVQDVLQATKLDTFFTIHADVDAALTAMQ